MSARSVPAYVLRVTATENYVDMTSLTGPPKTIRVPGPPRLETVPNRRAMPPSDADRMLRWPAHHRTREPR